VGEGVVLRTRFDGDGLATTRWGDGAVDSSRKHASEWWFGECMRLGKKEVGRYT